MSASGAAYAFARRMARAAGVRLGSTSATRRLFESAVAAVNRDGVPTTINGEAFRIDPQLRRLFPDVYEPDVAVFLRQHLAPGATCIEVGANVGVHTLAIARHCGATGRVIAFEPNPAARAVLARHVALNGFADRVSIIDAAVGATAGRATLYVDGPDPRSRLGQPNLALGTSAVALDVEVVTLDEWCSARGIVPDWLLIDVEGHEEAVLDGAAHLIRSRPALGVLVEMHPDTWTTPGRSRATLETRLATLGRRARSLSGVPDPLAELNVTLLEKA